MTQCKLLEHIPHFIVKDHILPCLSQIDTVCFMRSSKQCWKLVGKVPSVTDQYKSLGLCPICRKPARDTHEKCTTEHKSHMWKYSETNSVGGIIYKIEPTIPPPIGVTIVGPKFCDVINQDNRLTVSAVYRRLSSSNHEAMGYPDKEERLLNNHQWFLTNYDMIKRAQLHYKKHPSRVTIAEKVYIDIQMWAEDKMYSYITEDLPTTLDEYHGHVNRLYQKVIDMNNYLKRWQQTEYRDYENWYSVIFHRHFKGGFSYTYGRKFITEFVMKYVDTPEEIEANLFLI